MKTTPNNFLELSPPHCDYDSARFAVLPVPYDGGASFLSGARRAPAAIITASAHLEDYDDELGKECYKVGIATLDPIAPNNDGPGAMHEDLFKAAKGIVRDGKFLFAFGGDHSISSALIRACMTKHKKLSVLQIDAHCDLRDQFEKSRYSHACVMRRVVELGATVVPVGVRSVCREEVRFMKRADIHAISARECHTNERWMDRTLDALGDTVYVSIDIDAFDPAYAPGTGTPEPGGLDWYQVTELLRRVAGAKRIAAADIVEVIPLPVQVVTEYLAARLAYKLMGYVVDSS